MLKKISMALTMLLALTLAVALAQEKGKGRGKGKGPAAPGMALSSPDFEDGGIIPDKYTQANPNPVSPQLQWTNVPMGTVSFALIMHDPDAALAKNPEDVLHWMAFNIPGTARMLASGQPDTAELPDGMIQAKNRGGRVGYMGPGNPSQNPYHHYTIELFALDDKLSLGPDATREQVLDAMKGHILGKAVLEGRFRRPPA
jgi:Raf kinase inhibitor-like YbhB/YbcL family protein